MDNKSNNAPTSGANAAMAGVAGAVVGAGVAVAATKIMSDEKMRNKVVGTLNNVKDQVMDVIEKAREDGMEAAKEVGTKATDEAVKKLKK